MIHIQKEIVEGLSWAAAGYGRAGMGLMFAPRGIGRNAQAAIGNLAIATELLLKAYIANQNLALLYKDLPLDLRCALLAPDKMPAGFRIQPYVIDLKGSAYKSLELDEAISVFYIFFPEIKQRLNLYLRDLVRHRNICVHAVHPDCREYEVERAAFLLLTLVKHIGTVEARLVRYRNWGDKKSNEAFLARFNEVRLDNVHKKVEAARKRAKKITDKTSLSPQEWDWCPLQCPVCGSDGVVYGETQADADFDEDGVQEGVTLVFWAERFECDDCGLTLDDYDEMKVAGMRPGSIDRNDEVDKWQREHPPEYDGTDSCDET